MPVWGIPIHLLVSLIFGTLLTLFLEEPARNYFKKYLEKRKNVQRTEQDFEHA